MNIQLTKGARAALQAAERHAIWFNSITTTADLLVVLIRLDKEVAQFFALLGVNCDNLLTLLRTAQAAGRTPRIYSGPSQSFQTVIKQAEQFAQADQTPVGTWHLLQALLYQRPGLAGDVARKIPRIPNNLWDLRDKYEQLASSLPT